MHQEVFGDFVEGVVWSRQVIDRSGTVEMQGRECQIRQQFATTRANPSEICCAYPCLWSTHISLVSRRVPQAISQTCQRFGTQQVVVYPSLRAACFLYQIVKRIALDG